ncbi:MAG: LUD domain-containing protein [Cyclobacteriaceae bacterium]|nr:LUD domain-containing protein [Cyclobacteriaceae bacterium]
MGSREKILAAVKTNQPPLSPLPSNWQGSKHTTNLKEQFIQTVTNIGGLVIEVNSVEEIIPAVKDKFPETTRIVNLLESPKPTGASLGDPHEFENVTIAIMQGQLGVAENGAVWLTDKQMGDRVLPYICENLVLVMKSTEIVPTLHEAYERIGSSDYGLGTFLAGPSKTADIEQSLVLGAHGPKSLMVYLLP